MSGPPYKWQWIDSYDVDKDYNSNETNISLTLKSTSRDEPKPSTDAPENVESSCGDCIVYVGAIREVNGVGIKDSIDTGYAGIPSVEDTVNVNLTLDGTRGDIKLERGDVYRGEQIHDGLCRSTELGCTQGAIPSVESIDIENLLNSKDNEFTYRVRNVGPSPGEIELDVSGQNVDSQNIRVRLGPGESKTFTGSYVIPNPGGQAVVNVDASARSASDSLTESATRPTPNIRFGEISIPDRLCLGETGEVEVDVFNSSGAGNVDFNLEGNGFEDINTTVNIGSGQTVSFTTTMTMPELDSVAANISAETAGDSLDSTVSVSRKVPTPTISFDSLPDFKQPGKDMKVTVRGTVDVCEVPADISISGFADVGATENISPGNPASLTQQFSMPGRSINLEGNLNVLGTTRKVDDMVDVERAILIDSGNGVAVHSSKDRLEIDMMVVASKVDGAGKAPSSKTISEFTDTSFERALSMSPLNNATFVQSVLKDREFKNVLTDNLKFVKFGVSNDNPVSLCVDGEFREETTNVSYINVPNVRSRLKPPEQSDMG